MDQITFIATKAFEKAARRLFSSTQYSGLRAKLAVSPILGALIPKTGGARKLRHGGTRGQSRVIYYYHAGGGEIFFLACYAKSAKSDLSPAETRMVASIIEDIKRAKR